ncbi:DUF4245 family protein [Nocardioides carbamazepini]|uniref:DUF4245 family protein n=1 Tax=Nocardioides carbamazepini TaxID=2854259 RepID=UPI002149B3DF|nr:DUF4245 family protein [Nocardioides carbamazepini]MCR1784227.1 DUF4245 family protein [Nocardioides carbamazepini]
MSTQQAQPSGSPGRYQRSVVGLVTSLVVTVVAIAGLLYFMGVFRSELEIEPEAVDYVETVQSAQQAGLTPIYPATLPKDWIATGVDVTPGDDPVFMIRMLTDGGKFVAVRQEDSSVTALLSRWVDEKTEPADGYTVPADVPAPVARDWKGYADDGGDSAYAAEVGDETVLVFGSAPAEDLRAVVDVLVTTPIG